MEFVTNVAKLLVGTYVIYPHKEKLTNLYSGIDNQILS